MRALGVVQPHVAAHRADLAGIEKNGSHAIGFEQRGRGWVHSRGEYGEARNLVLDHFAEGFPRALRLVIGGGEEHLETI